MNTVTVTFTSNCTVNTVTHSLLVSMNTVKWLDSVETKVTGNNCKKLKCCK